MAIVSKLEVVSEYLSDLKQELYNAMYELERASESNAIDVCREVSTRLNEYYKAL